MSAPDAQPPVADRRYRRRGGVIGPVVLICIGGVFLLENTGYLPAGAWLALWRLWPLVLVLAGIELLLAHRLPRIALAALAGAVLAFGGMMMLMMGTQAPASNPVTRSIDTALGSSSQAAVTVRFGAGQLTVGPIVQPAPGQLATMTYDGPPELAPQPRYTPVNGGTGQLDYQLAGRGGSGFLPFAGGRADTMRLGVDLNPSVQIASLVVQSGAADAHLDLSSLRVSSLNVSVGAADTWVRFPRAGLTSAKISGGASSITLEIPQGVAAQIRYRGGLSTFNVDQTRFLPAGEDVYRSPEYATAQNRVDLDLATGFTTIQVS